MTRTYRYWGWLVAKIVVATGLSLGLYALLTGNRLTLVQRTFDGVLFGFWVLPMLWVALVWLCFLDQRYRCRTCARRLRMPLKHGSYASMLLLGPGVEYICPFGHGKLLIDLRLSDRSLTRWTRYGTIWQELLEQPTDQRG